MTKFGIIDFNVWENTKDPSFVDISIRSNVRHSWLNFERIISGQYSDSIVKPINKYVEALYPKPELISIDSSKIVLQQKTHAEIVVGYKDASFHTVDKPHIRQYYKSNDQYSIPNNCFPEVFKFYVPWIIDENVFVTFEAIDGSPFFVYSKEHVFNSADKSATFYEPPFVPFSFKKEGSHMIRGEDYGKILIGSPMFNIVIEANEEIIRKIKSFYEEA